MQPGEGPFQFMTKIDRLATGIHRPGGRSVNELRTCVIIVAGLSADYDNEVRMLENHRVGLDRAEIERVERNQYDKLLRQRHDSKALSTSGSTTLAVRGEKKRKSHKRFEGNCLNYGRKDHRDEDCRSAEKKIKISGDAPADKKVGGRKTFYVCGRQEHFAHKHCALCISLLHRTRDCEERGAENGAMVAKTNVPANYEMALVAATTGAARGDGKDEWDSDSGVSFDISYAQARMTAYKKTPAETTVEVADGNGRSLSGMGLTRKRGGAVLGVS